MDGNRLLSLWRSNEEVCNRITQQDADTPTCNSYAYARGNGNYVDQAVSQLL